MTDLKTLLYRFFKDLKSGNFIIEDDLVDSDYLEMHYFLQEDICDKYSVFNFNTLINSIIFVESIANYTDKEINILKSLDLKSKSKSYNSDMCTNFHIIHFSSLILNQSCNVQFNGIYNSYTDDIFKNFYFVEPVEKKIIVYENTNDFGI